MALKTYVLLSALDVNAPIYQHVGNGKRVQINKLPEWKPYLRVTFQDENGITKTARFKDTSKYVYQDDQIEKEKMLANTPWTAREIAMLTFRHGVLSTESITAQNYLESIPAMQGVKGHSVDYPSPCYKLLDEETDKKLKNAETRKRISAGQRIINLSLEDAQALLIRLYGSSFELPKDVVECQNILVEAMDQADEKGVDEFLREEINMDEEVSILIGKLLSAGTLSFDAIPNQVARKANGKWIEIKAISSEYTQEDRARYFSEFLTSDAGKLLLADLKKELQPQKDPSQKVQQLATQLGLADKDKNEGLTTTAANSAEGGANAGKDLGTVGLQSKEGQAPVNEENEGKIEGNDNHEENAANLKLAEEELKKAIDEGAHHMTIKKLEKKVADLKEIDNP